MEPGSGKSMVYMVKRRVSLGGIQEIEKVTEVWGTKDRFRRLFVYAFMLRGQGSGMGPKPINLSVRVARSVKP